MYRREGTWSVPLGDAQLRVGPHTPPRPLRPGGPERWSAVALSTQALTCYNIRHVPQLVTVVQLYLFFSCCCSPSLVAPRVLVIIEMKQNDYRNISALGHAVSWNCSFMLFYE